MTSADTTMVRYKSKVKVTVNATAQNSSSIKSITVNEITATNGIVEFDNASTNVFEIVVTDTRGNTTKKPETMPVIEYIPLTLSATVNRTGQTTNKVKIKYSGNYFNGNFGDVNNTLQVQYRVLQGSTVVTNWTNLTPTITGNTYSGETELAGTYMYNQAYTFEVKAIDKLTETPVSKQNIYKSIPPYAWGEDWFDVYVDMFVGNVYNGNNERLDNLPTAIANIWNKIYPVGSIYMSVNDIDPNTIFGGTWEKLENAFLLGSGTHDLGETGGAETHTLTIEEMPSHTHVQKGSYVKAQNGSLTLPEGWNNAPNDCNFTTNATGGGQPHSIMPPYLVVNMWKRTA